MYSVDKNNKNDVVGTGTVQEAGTASLGSIAKSSPTCGTDSTQNKAKSARRKRFELSREIRKIFLADGTKKGLLIPTKVHRQTLCKWAMTGEEVHLMIDEGTQKAFFNGVQTCGSVWCCPICANRIQEVRRQEIALVMAWFNSQRIELMGPPERGYTKCSGYLELMGPPAPGKLRCVAGFNQAVMVTFTFPHAIDDDLKTLLNKQAEALKLLRKGKSWDLFKKRIDFKGLIRSLEVTRGGNGWHPHTHELWFVQFEQDEEKFKEYLISRWLECCKKVGLVESDEKSIEAFKEHSVDIRFNCNSSDYLAKYDDKSHWGVDREIAKASSKIGKAKGMHPFELAYRGYSKLWLEYAEAFKGKSQLFWSKGLKNQIAIDDIDDKEISENESNEPYFVGAFNKDEWFEVLRKDLRVDLLEWSEEGKNINLIKELAKDNR